MTLWFVYISRVICPCFVPHLIMNMYVEFHFNAYHNYWEIVFFEEILSQKGGITQIKCWMELSSKNYQRYPFETWNTCSLSKEEPITTSQMTLWFVYISRVICPCFDIVHRN
jgi:hypothetical protein